MSTTTDEIAPGIFRISTFVPEIGPDGFTFNQFLLRDEQPLLFHTGPRAMFPAVSPATIALMHGSSFRGDGARALRALADLYDGWLREGGAG